MRRLSAGRNLEARESQLQQRQIPGKNVTTILMENGQFEIIQIVPVPILFWLTR